MYTVHYADLTPDEAVGYARRYMHDHGETLGGCSRLTTTHDSGRVMDVRYQATSERKYDNGKPVIVLDVQPTTWPAAPLWFEPIPEPDA